MSSLKKTCLSSSSSSLERRNVLVFQTRFSLILTMVTLFGLLFLSILFGDSSNGNEDSLLLEKQAFLSNDPHRWLQDSSNNETDQNYYSYSCNHLYSVTPDRGADQCHFARTCNQGTGVWSKWVFCTQWLNFNAVLGIMAPFMIVWMILLFRLLGSTAEDYFSPALEMYASKLGLPPRFAGVTLLALGNGAADVSATVSAISNDPQHGYLLSLGALTGAAMVISTVISALVVLVAGGVPCRGALVRDVAALGIAVLIVWHHLGGGNPDGGVVGPETVTLFLALYAAFVIMVLLADIYHRAIVLPRYARRLQERERQRQLDEQALHEQEIADATSNNNNNNNLHMMTTLQFTQPSLALSTPESPILGGGIGNNNPTSDTQPRLPSGRFTKILAALSNYSGADDTDGNVGWTAIGQGVESNELTQERPILLHGSRGLLNSRKACERAADNLAAEPALSQDELLPNNLDDSNIYTAMLGDGTCGATVDHSWSEAWNHSWVELKEHADEVWDDIAYDGDLDVVTKFFLILEVPFTIVRKITVPIPCEGYYVRGLLALSMALSPLWMALYLWFMQGRFLFNNVIFGVYWVVVLVAAGALLRYAPMGDGADLSVWISTPLALYGFVIAATWVDVIADALVSLLDFIGIVLRIPGPIIGLTILAWGNSMSDLSANITMAKKGLANMAITACFAGPFFNILVGLGLGFSSLAAQTGVAERAVKLQPSISAGFWFLAINSVTMLIAGFWYGNKIPKRYGYIALTIYSTYVISSLAMQYSKSVQNG